MANPQPENGFVKLANEIWNEIIRRDFSKRQKDIILFIWRLSYGCQKKTASIPLLKYFELCGVGYQNIRKELDHLSNCRVIVWNKNNNIFAVNKDYEQWQISPVKGWNEEIFKDLVSKNINFKSGGTSQNKKPEKSKVHGIIIMASQNKKLLLLKTRSSGFSKREVEGASNPCGCKAKRVSKNIIKNIIKNNSSCCLEEDTEMDKGLSNKIKSDSQDAVPAGDADSNRKAAEFDYRKQVTDLYLKRRAKGLDLTVNDELFLDQLIADGVPISVAIDGINQSFDKFKPKHKRDEIKSIKYCEGRIYNLLSEQDGKIDEQKISTVIDSKTKAEPDYDQEEYQKKLERLKAKREAVV
ncbi:replication protein [Paenibacillus sp. FSL R10-2796]|uniref:replication protein n=1 Tax=Paenibacillus sp. FSL R10-2796 TaxID=2954663 RepID=UPI0030D8E4BD